MTVNRWRWLRWRRTSKIPDSSCRSPHRYRTGRQWQQIATLSTRTPSKSVQTPLRLITDRFGCCCCLKTDTVQDSKGYQISIRHESVGSISNGRRSEGPCHLGTVSMQVSMRTPSFHGPFTRRVKLWVSHATGIPGTFSPPPSVSDPDMHHGTCVTHVPWFIPGSLTGSFLWSRGRENVPGIPGACATRNFTYLVRGPYKDIVIIYVLSWDRLFIMKWFMISIKRVDL